MSGHFPFGSPAGAPGESRESAELRNLQMRAALGLPRADDLSTLPPDQLQRLEAYDREVRYRNALYQEQLAQEMQRRALAAAELEQLPGISPGLRQTYAGLLLQERLARGAEAEALAAHQQAAALAAYRNQALYGAGHPLSAQGVAAARYEEDLRNQQQAVALAQLRGAGVPGLENLALQTVGSGAGVSSQAVARQASDASSNDPTDPSAREDDYKMAARKDSTEGRARANSRASPAGSVEMEDLAIEQHKNSKPLDVAPSITGKTSKQDPMKKKRKGSSKSPSAANDDQPVVKKKRGRPRKTEGAAKAPYKKREKLASEVEERMRAEAILQAMADRAAGMRHQEIDASPYLTGETQQQIAQNLLALPKSKKKKDKNKSPDTPPLLGTIDGLLSAAETESRLFDGAEMLASLKLSVEHYSDDEAPPSVRKEPPQAAGLPVPKEPLRSIRTPRFVSHFPKLPEEPLDDLEDYVDAEIDASKQASSSNGERKSFPDEHKQKTKASVKPSSKFPNILDFPYPVDSWFPTISSRKRERHQSGETSDEDNFIEEVPPAGEDRGPFRVNKKKIKARLDNEVEPGLLEKIPHCRIHRLKRKNSTLAELVYCCQVTECYPNEVMVCCSRCGTWRHAACGGHYEPYSVKKQSDKEFVAVCEQCHEEDKLFLNDNPTANKRIERQRMEQLRRGLATSAVMRSMSFSKHGGTYKWPLGSVSATHVGGHTRSVQSRHDKAEKQWADLINRLGRNGGSRAKERQRVRTKELERLLTAVEDAEGQTDRHNMLLFLMRDTRKRKPAGFEEEKKNRFDTCYSETEFDSMGYTSGRLQEEDQQVSESDKRPKCLRENCNKDARFDSKFCSDGCGVSVLESDLLKAFYESSEIHPSVLRSHY